MRFDSNVATVAKKVGVPIVATVAKKVEELRVITEFMLI